MGRIHLGLIPRYHAGRKPAGAIAVVHPEGAMTWRELDERSNQRARHLGDAGVLPGDTVMIALDNSNAFFEVIFAIWKLGATPNPISSRLPALEASEIVALAQPRVVVTNAQDWIANAPCVRADTDLRAFSGAPLADPPRIEYWRMMTSGGSTGRPKLIISHQEATTDPDQLWVLQPKDGVILNPGPLYHSGPLVYALVALFTGSTVIGMHRFDAEEALRLIERHRVQWVNFVPTMMQRIWALSPETRRRYSLDSLESVWHSSAPMPVWLKENWISWIGAEKIWENYGGTENLGSTLIGGVEWLTHPGSVGRPNPPGTIKIFREDGTECAPGETGEIYFLPKDGAGSSYHYVGADPKRNAGGWDSLGDLGWFDVDGFLYLADRRADLILRGGANVYPAEVEAAIGAHPAVGSCAVVGLPHPDLGQEVHAIVEFRDDAEPEIDALDRFVGERLSAYKTPASYEISPEPLRDDAGKVRRSALRDVRKVWLHDGTAFRLFPSSGKTASTANAAGTPS